MSIRSLCCHVLIRLKRFEKWTEIKYSLMEKLGKTQENGGNSILVNDGYSKIMKISIFIFNPIFKKLINQQKF